MKKPGLILGVAAALLLAAATPALFKSPTESKWTVTAAGKPVATVTVLTDGKSLRAEWKPLSSGPTVVFLGGKEKLWIRATGGDVEVASHKGGIETSIVPALMLPFKTAAATDKVEHKQGRVSSYAYSADGAVKAAYRYDASGPDQIEVSAGGKKYTLTRSTIGKPAVNSPDTYAVRPRKSAATQISKLAGDLFGASDTQVSATAGARGVERGGRFADGGDYDALATLETKQQERSAKMDEALRDFQRQGKVGQAQEE